MLQFNKDYIENEKYIISIITEAEKVLNKRKANYERYCKTRGLPIERYITTTGTSYFAGKEPIITIKKETDEIKKNLIKKIFNKIIGKNNEDVEYKLMLDYINEYNDLPAFFYEIAKDYFGTNACYWISYETTENEIVFAHVSSLQSVALYDYSTPVQLIGGLRIYDVQDAQGRTQRVAELTLNNEKRYYINNNRTKQEYKEDVNQREEVKWELTPFYAVENPDGLSLFDSVKDLIDALEQVIDNQRNTFQYNDDAKLKITGYTPENSLTIEDENGNVVINKDRIKEDEALLQAKVFYTPDNSGDIDWIIKNVNDTAILNYNKTLVDFIFMLAMVPNMNDISFTNSDSGKAIEYKFFGLEQVLIEADKLFKKELLRMYENITYRINAKKKTNFDFREIDINLVRNLPVSKEDVTAIWLGLRDLLSEETIISNLPLDLDAKTEIAKKQEESEQNMENALNNVINRVNNKEIEETEEPKEENQEIPEQE